MTRYVVSIYLHSCKRLHFVIGYVMASFCINVGILCFILLLNYTDARITCKDNDGQPVDWFSVYKLPKIKKSSTRSISEGLAFYYMDENSPNWQLSKLNINQSGQAVERTLSQVYDNGQSQDVLYLLYNDESPHKKVVTFDKGHTKGVVVADKTSVVWLVHSVPQYPPYLREGAYSYPDSGMNNGQTMLCVTYSYTQLDIIGKQLLFNYPLVYDQNFPDGFVGDNPNIKALLSGGHTKHEPWTNIVTLPSLNGRETFTSFAKYTDFHADLYASLVAPHYHADLLVETWRNQKGPMPSNCSGANSVKNVDSVQFAEAQFKYTKDHSKWAVGDTQLITCIGDINRDFSQQHRAGGTVCFNNADVWKGFRRVVDSSELCPQKKAGHDKLQDWNRISKP